MGSLSELTSNQERSVGRAAVLGLGTANPPFTVEQSGYPDFYFNVTNTEHKTDLKRKFVRICNSSMIKKRHSYLTPDGIKGNPSLLAYDHNSLDSRQELMDAQMPELGAQAALEAVKDWGRPLSDITHLIFCNSGGASMPGADYDVINILGLPLSTKRFMLHQQGCFGGGSVLRLAKDLAENNRGARVLVICCELVSIAFRGPSEDHIENLVVQALFGDGASAAVVGADTQTGVERQIFEIVWTSQDILPGSDGAIVGKLREAGLMVSLHPLVPFYITENIEKLVQEALRPLGVTDWNEVFWVVHPGGRAILDDIQKKLKLRDEKFAATREVLREYGNMSSASVMFVMDVMRKRSKEKGLSNAGEGLEWGLLLGFGPGITVETILLRSI
ncbi:chalcone synthase 1B-like [Iris pallida]|uniref:Chalcone synthase 1B-like n=1 Tax=Iris pallida TaxID=29817 RepID=A0AAX6HAC6_IRIPA|nr:chalcone synthase 1B-like [Iris pallida]KAJ6837682.1 chalcone synthase 1B-like [Iris pallida]